MNTRCFFGHQWIGCRGARRGQSCDVKPVWMALLTLAAASLLHAQPEPLGQEAILPNPVRQSMRQVLLASPEYLKRAEQSVRTPEFREAEGWFQSNQAPRAVALLAAVVRKDPSNQSAGDRLLAALSQRSFPRLMEVSNAPVQPTSGGRWPCQSPDGERELRRLDDQSGRLYEVRTGKPLGMPLKHASGISAAWFSPDGLRVATICMSDGSARIWDATTGMPLSPLLKHQSSVNSARFSADGLLLLTGSCDGTARLWDGFTGAPRSEPMKVGNWIVSSAEFSPDGRHVIAITYEREPRSAPQRLCYVFDVLPGACLGEAAEVRVTRREGFAGTTNRTVRIWDLETGRLLGPSGLSDRGGSATTIWDVATGQPLGPARLDGFPASIQFSPDGRSLIVWHAPRCRMPVPAWLPDLAEAIIGMRLNQKMVPTNVPWAERLRIQKQLAEAPASDACSRWAQWFLADRSTRATSYASGTTVPEYVQRRIQENTLASLREAVSLSPTHGLAFARLATLALAQKDEENPRHLGEADFFSRYAVKLAPQDAEVAKIRAEIEERMKNRPKPGT